MSRVIYQSYQQEILYLQRHGNKLLQKIKQQETKMNRKKQQNFQPNQKDLYTLQQMIKKLLRMLAFIDSYRYFQIINVPLYQNQTWFHEIAYNYYEDTLQRFMLRLKLKIDRSVHFIIKK